MPRQPLPSKILPDEGHFVGRENQLAHLSALVSENKLVVIEGLSGIGKTALALCYVYQNAGDYEAVAWCEIEPGESAGSVLARIAAQLNEQGYDKLLDAVTDPKLDRRKRARALLDVLRETRTLLVLDAFNNCLERDYRVREDLSWLVNQLLRRTYPSRVLLTTKVKPKFSPADLEKYAAWQLTGLEYREATALFDKLCAEIDHEAEPEQVALVCRTAGGHPFTIKIVVGLLYQGHLLQSLLDPMRKLVVDGYGEFLLDLFYTRLTRGARRLLEACAVYRRPVKLAAIQKLPAEPALMDQLLPCFLLELERRSRRYYMHTIVREYAYDKLARNPER
ncbi:MAG: NB-ARC domain-containing protein, partial [Anaerolineae bacterium]